MLKSRCQCCKNHSVTLSIGYIIINHNGYLQRMRSTFNKNFLKVCISWFIFFSSILDLFNFFVFCNRNFGCPLPDDVKTFIIFSNRHEIRRLDTHAETYVPLVSGLRNTIALDFYYNHSSNGENSAIFWTDVVDDKIYKGVLISNCEC